MKKINRLLFIMMLMYIPCAFGTLHVVAAENFYGDLAKQLGGENVEVVSIMKNPQQDPHFFNASPSSARAVAKADIVIYNGLGYDNWMSRLLSLSAAQDRKVIVVGNLAGVKSDGNPHIWYFPETMSIYANEVVRLFILLDPGNTKKYETKLAQFKQNQQTLEDYIISLKKKFQGLPITATEPIFIDMAKLLGLEMRNQGFQWSVENEGSPSTSAMKTMINDLTHKRVRVLIYNTQVTSPLIDNIKEISMQNQVPVLGITETQPGGMTYHQWMQTQLKQLEKVLQK